MLMDELGDQLEVVPHLLHLDGVMGQFGRQSFEGNLDAPHFIQALIDHAHPALAQFAHDAVAFQEPVIDLAARGLAGGGQCAEAEGAALSACVGSALRLAGGGGSGPGIGAPHWGQNRALAAISVWHFGQFMRRKRAGRGGVYFNRPLRFEPLSADGSFDSSTPPSLAYSTRIGGPEQPFVIEHAFKLQVVIQSERQGVRSK